MRTHRGFAPHVAARASGPVEVVLHRSEGISTAP